MSREVRATVIGLNSITNQLTVRLSHGHDADLHHGDKITITIPEADQYERSADA